MFKSISRLALEHDPEKRMNVKYMDYDELEVYSGSLIFQAGLSKINFTENAIN